MTTSDDRAHHDARLANRATLFTFASLCSFVAATLTIPLTVQRTEALAPRVVASAPLALGVGAGVMARAARAQLRAFRNERESAAEDELAGGIQAPADAGASPGAAPTGDGRGRREA